MTILENLNNKTNIQGKTKAEIMYELTLAYIPFCTETNDTAKAVSLAQMMYNRLQQTEIVKEI